MFDKILNPRWAKLLCFVGQLFPVVYGHILKNNLAIWSHCVQRSRRLVPSWKTNFSFCLILCLCTCQYLTSFFRFKAVKPFATWKKFHRRWIFKAGEKVKELCSQPLLFGGMRALKKYNFQRWTLLKLGSKVKPWKDSEGLFHHHHRIAFVPVRCSKPIFEIYWINGIEEIQ